MGEDNIALLAASAVGLIELVERILERAVAAGGRVAVDVNDRAVRCRPDCVSGMPPDLVVSLRQRT